MIKEENNLRQINGDPERRWFSDQFFDLIVWFDENDKIIGFQLCYDKQKDERSLTWKEESGYAHHRIDDGEKRPGRFKSSPILVTDGIFDSETISNIFKEESQHIDQNISTFVYKKLLEQRDI